MQVVQAPEAAAAERRSPTVDDNIGLVYTVFRRLTFHPDVDVEDVLAEGLVALVLAARRYDPTRGAFSTLACKMIESRMRDARRTRRYRRLRLIGVGREDGADLAQVADGCEEEEPSLDRRECRQLLEPLLAHLHAKDKNLSSSCSGSTARRFPSPKLVPFWG